MYQTQSFFRLLLGASLLYAAASSISAQEKKEEIWSESVTVTDITIAVTVQDKDGRYINNLTEADFTIYENKTKQTITHFQHDFKAPLSLTILLDVSGSMALQDKMEDTREALARFINNVLDPRDEVALLIFADGEVEVAAGYSEDKTRLLEVLAKTQAYGKTALNDAVAVSPEYARKGKNAKKALLLITDGIENDSQYSPAEAADIAKKVDVPIYTVAYKIPLDDQLLSKHKTAAGLTATGIVESLERFSRATGGKAFFANSAAEMHAALREIKMETSHQYLLGYTSHREMKENFRSIRVLTKNNKYKVRTREGY